MPEKATCGEKNVMRICVLFQVKPLFDFVDKLPSHLGFGLQKNSEFKPLFDYTIIRLREAGLLVIAKYAFPKVTDFFPIAKLNF